MFEGRLQRKKKKIVPGDRCKFKGGAEFVATVTEVFEFVTCMHVLSKESQLHLTGGLSVPYLILGNQDLTTSQIKVIGSENKVRTVAKGRSQGVYVEAAAKIFPKRQQSSKFLGFSAKPYNSYIASRYLSSDYDFS